jgi:hypothetical protein
MVSHTGREYPTLHRHRRENMKQNLENSIWSLCSISKRILLCTNFTENCGIRTMSSEIRWQIKPAERFIRWYRFIDGERDRKTWRPHKLFTYTLSPSREAASCAPTQRISQHLMKAEFALPRSQQLSTGPHLEPYKSSPYHPILSL